MDIRKIVREVLQERVAMYELRSLEAELDKLFATLGIDVEFTQHFKDRMNDQRNKPEIDIDELRDLFEKTFKYHGEKIANLSKGAEKVINDINTYINIPFVLSWNPKTQMIELINKTVMRKKNFKSYTPKLKV